MIMPANSNNIGLNNVQQNPYSKFSKVDYSQNRNYLSNAYGRKPTVQYYNDDKEKRNKKIKNALILGSVGLTILGGVALGFRTHKGKFKDYSSKFSNLMLNFTTLKDDAWDRIATTISEKTPFKFVKKLGDKYSDFYRKNVYKALKPKYEKIQEEILKTRGNEKIKDKLVDFDTLFNDLNDSMLKTIKEDRVSSKKNILKGEKFSFETIYKNLTRPIGDDKISSVIYDSKSFIEVPENASAGLKKLIDEHNNLLKDMLIPKLRDINFGCAPTDVITGAIPVLGFGVAMANSDKEERKSLMLNLGVPLLPSIFMPLLGTRFPILNGVKAMIAGFAIGQVVSNGVKIVDKQLNKNQNETDYKA